MELRVLAVGDVTYETGLRKLEKTLRVAKQRYGVHFCVVNGENAGGAGLSPQHAERMLDAGADVITLGNHTFRRREICTYLDENRYILRPANLLSCLPGRGWGIFDTAAGPVAVVNLLGRYHMDNAADNPFFVIDRLLPEFGDVPVLLDFHAEATSEKRAMGFYLDGRVSAVWGTHTHVQTADTLLLPKGTGYVTDLGMTGPVYSALGTRPDQSIALFRGELGSRYESASGPCALQGAVFTIDTASRRCTHAEGVSLCD